VADDGPGVTRGHRRGVVEVGGDGRVPVAVEVGDDALAGVGRHLDVTGHRRRIGGGRPGQPDLDPMGPGRDLDRIGDPLGLEGRERQRPVDVGITYEQDGMATQFALRVLRALTVRFNADAAAAPRLPP
jgi:hypothetical protein